MSATRSFRRAKIIAAILVCFSVGGYVWFSQSPTAEAPGEQPEADTAPATDEPRPGDARVRELDEFEYVLQEELGGQTPPLESILNIPAKQDERMIIDAPIDFRDELILDGDLDFGWEPEPLVLPSETERP